MLIDLVAVLSISDKRQKKSSQTCEQMCALDSQGRHQEIDDSLWNEVNDRLGVYVTIEIKRGHHVALELMSLSKSASSSAGMG